jgi:hypothetical protein
MLDNTIPLSSITCHIPYILNCGHHWNQSHICGEDYGWILWEWNIEVFQVSFAQANVIGPTFP